MESQICCVLNSLCVGYWFRLDTSAIIFKLYKNIRMHSIKIIQNEISILLIQPYLWRGWEMLSGGNLSMVPKYYAYKYFT